jgi:hypothetical protein
VVNHAHDRVAFLIGSGASLDAGSPSTTDLTHVVLSGDGYMRHSDGTYLKGPPLYGEESDSHVPHLASFLRWLACHLSRYYEATVGRPPNYEDLYYVVEQILAEEVGELENVLVLEGQRGIRPRLCDCAERILPSTSSPSRMNAAALEILNYITWVVSTELHRSGGAADYLEFIEEAGASSTSSHLAVFTVNHEHLLEDYLGSRHVPVIDGFGPPVGSVRYWDPRTFETDVPGCFVLKLHGSIRWFRFRPDGGDWWDERVGLPLTPDIQHTRAPDGRPQRAIDFRPLLLIGTFNKIPDYTGGVFVDLFAQFRRRLGESDALVVCGYGFGDKGINSQIIEWLYGDRGRRIVVVHPEPASLRGSARGAIRNKWDTWLEEGVLRLCTSKARDATWSKIAAEVGG